MGVFLHLRPPKTYFFKVGLCHFCTIMVTNFMQKKILRAVSEISKVGRTMDQGLRTNGQGRLLGTPSSKPGVQNI